MVFGTVGTRLRNLKPLLGPIIGFLVIMKPKIFGVIGPGFLLSGSYITFKSPLVDPEAAEHRLDKGFRLGLRVQSLRPTINLS